MTTAASGTTDSGTTRSGTTLRPRWVLPARAAWWVVAATAIVSFVVVLIGIAAGPTAGCDGSAVCNPALFTTGDAAVAARLGLPVRGLIAFELASIMIGRLSLFAVAVLIFLKRPDDAIAFVLSISMIAALLEGGTPAELGPVSQVANVLYVVAGALFIPLPFIFPNGRFVPRWSRLTTAPLTVLIMVTTAAGRDFAAVFGLANLVWLVLAIVAMLERYRRHATSGERDQIRWALLGIGCTFLVVPGFLALGTVYAPGEPSAARLTVQVLNGALYGISYAGAAICLAIAMLRHHLWGVALVLNRALVFGVLSTFVVAVYVLVVGGLGAVLQGTGNVVLAFVATAVIALAVNPFRVRTQRAVNRLMYGDRDDPYAVLTRLRGRLDLAGEPQAVLPVVVETVAQALKLPFVSLSLDGGAAVQVGLPVAGDTEGFAVTYQGEPIGRLEVAPRPGDRLTAEERRLLGDIAIQAGVAARAVQLGDELQHARQRLVTAREEERRRLRRDLHDGLGPKLAGQALILEAVRDALPTDAAEPRGLVEHLIEDSQEAVGDLRHLVDALRPPALDQLGLVGAIGALGQRLDAAGVVLRVEAAEPLPPLPAAVEVAAYRIAQEALTNVLKHAQAGSAIVSLGVTGESLVVEVNDGGVGLPESPRRGVGLGSMRERAEEIGGSLEIRGAAGSGTRVVARLPLGTGAA